MSRVSVQVELFDSRSTSPACSAVKRCWPDSGTYFTFSESPKSAAEMPRQMSTFMPVHLPWLSTVMKPAMPPTADAADQLAARLDDIEVLAGQGLARLRDHGEARGHRQHELLHHDLSRPLLSMGQPVDRTSFPGLAPVSSPFSKMGTPEQIVMS